LHADYGRVTEGLIASGEFLSGDQLAAAETATTVRRRGGSTEVTDGPFVESKEHLVGYYLIDVKDLDRAVEIAGQIPDTRWGGVEVRPVMDMSSVEM
jgi:hypothetical protein